MRALITGINGFVGPYLKNELETQKYYVAGMDKSDPVRPVDITKPDEILKFLTEINPDMIFHLAGFSSVAESFKHPDLCWKINVDGTRNILNACSAARIRPKILIVSSSQVYGKPEKLPIDEKHPLNGDSPYAKSRIEQERIALGSDQHVVIARSFNHTGPTQPDNFVIPSFKKQILEANDGDTIYVGNLDVIRDFSDVRDVVKAYIQLLEKSPVGEIYNVGSGNGYNLKTILTQLIEKSGKNLSIEVDPERFRPSDVPEHVCDNSKLRKIIDFQFRRII